MSMESHAVEIESLSRNFDRTHAVVDVSLKVAAGEIYALIGPNGAGKTTLIKMLVGLLAPDKGTVTICGQDIVKHPLAAKTHFGYIPDNPLVYDYLTGYEFLHFTGALRGMRESDVKHRVKELAAIFPLGDVLTQKMGSYSRGNRQKTAFLAALISHPDLLVIDEPIAGLDPGSITIFGETLRQFAGNGGAVFLATHILSFGQAYADRVGAMNAGRLRHESPVSQHNLEQIYRETADSQ